MEAPQRDRKLFVGSRIKRLRRDLGLTQSRMASDLGISPSYLNLIEANQRPVTAPLLLRLAENWDVDLKTLSGEADPRSVVDLAEVLADPLLKEFAVPRQEMIEVAEAAPGIVDAVARLYRAYLEAKRREELTAQRLPAGDGREPPPDSPVERVRAVIEENHNHFPTLDEAAETLAAELAADGRELRAAATDRLRDRHGVTVRVLPVDVMATQRRRYDRHRRQLLVSELLEGAGRSFAIACQLGLMEAGPLIDRIADRAGTGAAPLPALVRRMLRAELAGYWAAALMMPYGRFLAAAEQTGYDIPVLGARFGASFEQVCHRLTTLSRPTARGVPFFMMRVDHAGNITKRFAAGRVPFSRFGGTCPRWSIHAAFAQPLRLLTQIVELPDGARYFTLARTVGHAASGWGEAEPERAIGLGCEIRYAGRLVHARGLDLERAPATPIGINCGLCERPDCTHRAAPPLARTLVADEWSRDAVPFQFA